MAARLSRDTNLTVRRQRGGFGELRVAVDGVDVVDSSRLAYPTPGGVVKRVENYLAQKTEA